MKQGSNFHSFQKCINRAKYNDIYKEKSEENKKQEYKLENRR